MDTPQYQIIEQEIHDISGLLCDLYRRVAASSPERASEIARALAANARHFAAIQRGTQ